MLKAKVRRENRSARCSVNIFLAVVNDKNLPRGLGKREIKSFL
jgi:hypothetical protein